MSADVNTDEPKIAAQVEQLGGSVIRDKGESTRPVTDVRFVGRVPDVQLLDQLARLPKLTSMSMQGCTVSAAVMKQLGGIKGLQALSLYGSKTTEEGLGYLRTLTTLQELWLDKSNITDAGLKEIGATANLQWLSLADTKITDGGVRHLASMRMLGTLHLDDTSVGDEGLKTIGRLTRLQDLSLYNTRITDKGLVHLRTLTDLQWLVVGNTVGPRGETGISDAGLEELRRVRTLFFLDLWGTTVTAAGVQRFHRYLPTCGINSPDGKIESEPAFFRKTIPGTHYWQVFRVDNGAGGAEKVKTNKRGNNGARPPYTSAPPFVRQNTGRFRTAQQQ